jgi:hypothetical protein
MRGGNADLSLRAERIEIDRLSSDGQRPQGPLGNKKIQQRIHIGAEHCKTNRVSRRDGRRTGGGIGQYHV